MKVLGRDAEQTRLQGILDSAARGGGGVAILRGDAGIGKTALLRRLRRYALQSGHVVRSGRATELESDIPYALVRAAGVGTPAREGSPGDQPALPAWQAADELRRQLTASAAGRPLTVVLDDVHWADAASLDVLAALLSRPPQTPGALVLATRPGPAADALVRMATAGPRGCQVLDLAPLGDADASKLLAEWGFDIDPVLVIRASGGNPLLLRELAGHAGDDVPPGIVALVQHEVAGCSADAQRFLEAGSLLGDPFDPGVATAVAGLTEPQTQTAMDELVVRRLIVAAAEGPGLRFRHPVVRSAVLEALPAGRRRAMHRAAAAALSAAGVPATRIARHLLHVATAGDTETAQLLVSAADAIGRRSPSTAADWYLAAARCDARVAQQRWDRTFTALVQAGRAEEALARAEEQLAHLPVAEQDPRVVLLCAALERVLGRVRASERRLAALDPAAVPPGMRAGWLGGLSASAFYAGDFERVGPLARQALADAEGLHSPVLAAEAHALAAMAEHARGGVAAAADLAGRARALMDSASEDDVLTDAEAAAVVPWTLVQIDRFDDVLALARRGVRTTRTAANAVATVPFALAEILTLALTGRLTEAAVLGDRACAEARTTRLDQPLQWALWLQAWVLAEVDEVPRAVRLAEEAWTVSERLEPSVLTTNARSVYGSSLIIAGQPDRGVPLLTRHDEPGWICRWAPRLVEGLHALGEAEAARAHVRAVAAISAELGLASTQVGVHQATALVALHDDDPLAARESAGAAVAAAQRAGLPVERARGLGLLATAQEQLGSPEHADTWRLAQQAARDAGALRLDREFGRAVRRVTRRRARSATAVPGNGLSRRQQEVAALVAQGLTNREIAGRLFLSEKTVETHVSAALTKLGVPTRAALAAFAAADDDSALPR